MPPKFTRQQRHQIARRYAAGESPSALAAEFGCHHSAVIGLARRRGIATPKRPTLAEEFQKMEAASG